jgi:hypothetical protein
MNAIVTTDNQPLSLGQMIAIAANDPNVDAEKMERMFALYERMQARDAETAFNVSLKKAQGEVARVPANKFNSQTKSAYADYAQLDRVLRPIYTTNGFSLSFDSDRLSESEIMIICYVSHEGGHTRTYKLPMPADGKGAKGGDVMTKTHATGSATQYGMRYMLKMIFNVAIGQDDDGNAAAGVGLTESDKQWIEKAEKLERFEDYQDLRREVIQHYGSSAKVPPDVATAMNKARDQTKPRD